MQSSCTALFSAKLATYTDRIHRALVFGWLPVFISSPVRGSGNAFCIRAMTMVTNKDIEQNRHIYIFYVNTLHSGVCHAI